MSSILAVSTGGQGNAHAHDLHEYVQPVVSEVCPGAVSGLTTTMSGIVNTAAQTTLHSAELVYYGARSAPGGSGGDRGGDSGAELCSSQPLLSSNAEILPQFSNSVQSV